MTFKPPWYLRNRHFQTILPNITRPSFPAIETQRLELSDGDFVDLLWSNTRAAHTLLIMHGLEGSIHSPYASRIVNFCNRRGIAAVFMHFRSCSGEINRLLRGYHSGETGDLRQVIAHLKSTGIATIDLLGYSLGGNVTLKYMGESETDPVIRSAIAVSVPFRLDVCADTMNRGFAKIYQSTLLKRLIKKMLAKQNLLDESGIDFPDPSKMRHFREFDDNFTAPIHGFSSEQDYYLRSSSRQFLANIDKPTLIIQARDDPFMTREVLPEYDEMSDSVSLELSDHGGHVGFVGNHGLTPAAWLESRIYRHLLEQ